MSLISLSHLAGLQISCHRPVGGLKLQPAGACRITHSKFKAPVCVRVCARTGRTKFSPPAEGGNKVTVDVIVKDDSGKPLKDEKVELEDSGG